jgi:hypothetical protein
VRAESKAWQGGAVGGSGEAELKAGTWASRNRLPCEWLRLWRRRACGGYGGWRRLRVFAGWIELEREYDRDRVDQRLTRVTDQLALVPGLLRNEREHQMPPTRFAPNDLRIRVQ